MSFLKQPTLPELRALRTSVSTNIQLIEANCTQFKRYSLVKSELEVALAQMEQALARVEQTIREFVPKETV